MTKKIEVQIAVEASRRGLDAMRPERISNPAFAEMLRTSIVLHHDTLDLLEKVLELIEDEEE